MWQYYYIKENSQAINHSKILKILEASYECIELRSMIQHAWELCELSSIKDNLIVLHKDNVESIVQIKGGYIKHNLTTYSSLNSSTLMSFKRAMKFMFTIYKSTHEDIIVCCIEKAKTQHWNVNVQRFPSYYNKGIIIIFTWGRA